MKITNNKKESEKMKNVFIGIMGIFLLVLLGGSVLASGVVTPYWADKPLRLSPGESKTVTLILQNAIGEEADLEFSVQLSGGTEVASLVNPDSVYSVPYGSIDVPVEILVSVPEETELGQKYTVALSFTPIVSGEGGMVEIASGFTTNFPVEVVSFDQSSSRNDVEEPSSFPWGTLVIIVILVIAVLVLLLKNKSKK